MDLTLSQKTTLKAHVMASIDPLVVAARAIRNDTELARLYNLDAAPVFRVWKTNVSITDIGDNVVATELAGMSALNTDRFRIVILLMPSGVNPGLADRRAFFDDIFSGAGGALTRAKLALLWKRNARVVERVFATGTGSDASPGTLVVEGEIDVTTMSQALNLP